MKFLIDTNIFIPLEPAQTEDIENNSVYVATIHSFALEHNHQLYLHPTILTDIQNDKNIPRKNLRTRLIKKYPVLSSFPSPTDTFFSSIGQPLKGSNDWIDAHLLYALHINAVDFLITEDKQIFKNARKIGLEDRCLGIQESLTFIKELSDVTPYPPPDVISLKAYEINTRDEIFESLRIDYPTFDHWFNEKCCREHRQSWIIKGDRDKIAGLCIINPENNHSFNITGKILKICTFKIADWANGYRYGELLLKTVFEYANKNNYSFLYMTAFEKQDRLIRFVKMFGFDCLEENTELGEFQFLKCLKPSGNETSLSPLQYHIKYGPFRFQLNSNDWFIIPIQNRYTDILFPETNYQQNLFPIRSPYGNAIRKAYLCNSPIKEMRSGSVICFYRSGNNSGLIALGIVEDTIKSNSIDEIIRFVSTRTVYSYKEISEMCSSSNTVLAILFRQSFLYNPIIKRTKLENANVFQRPPQSIMKISIEGIEWLKSKIM